MCTRPDPPASAALTAWLLLALGGLHATLQAQAAYGQFLRPGDAITEDTARIAIPTVINGDTIVAARFHVRYSSVAANSADIAAVEELIGVDTTAPFEVLWDCSAVPDQDNHNLHFHCTVLTSRGERKGGPAAFRKTAALDRTASSPDKLLRVVHDTRPLAFDGDLREWKDCPSIEFTNGDNRISARACWNSRFLSFAVRVDDATVFPSPTNAPPGLDTIMPVHLQDGIEFFFDLLHDRASVRGDDDYHILIGATGVHAIHSPIAESTPSHAPLLAVRSDAAGYSVEVGFSWDQLPFSPAPGSIIGFNLVNSDREAFDGAVATANWAGIPNLRHHNPSEWASLVLVRRHARWPWVLLVIVAAGAALVVVRRFRKKHVLERPARLSPVLRDMMAFLEENYQNEKLDSRAVAASVKISGPYLARIIKRETGKNFREVLNEFRLHKARSMLLETDLSISEVAYQAGFSSPGQFSEVFARFEHTTPSEYRKRKK
ncbi:MAG: helix-turn-helix domain-containing protein [Chitinivibrionales bacterium]|nr:helix-turn-helix domain-containing protein [Chitinivibrionales bacterium]